MIDTFCGFYEVFCSVRSEGFSSRKRIIGKLKHVYAPAGTRNLLSTLSEVWQNKEAQATFLSSHIFSTQTLHLGIGCCSAAAWNSTRLPCLDLGQVNFSPLRPFIALCRLTQMWVWWSPETGMFSASAWKNIPEGCDMARPCKTYLGILRQSIFSTWYCGHLHAIMCTLCFLDICNMSSLAWRFIAKESQSLGIWFSSEVHWSPFCLRQSGDHACIWWSVALRFEARSNRAWGEKRSLFCFWFPVEQGRVGTRTHNI